MISGATSVVSGYRVRSVFYNWLRSLKGCCSLFCVLALCACSHTPVSLTMFEVAGIGKSVDSLGLNPNLSYLRVTVGVDRVVLMVLGYLEPIPQGTIETWYSNEGEVLKLQNGRVVSTAGLEVDWRAVRYSSLLSWPEMVHKETIEFVRQTDQMPGYKYGIEEKVSIANVRVPSNSNLVGMSPDSLRWYEETVQGTSHGLPSARYGLRLTTTGPTVVYGQQCFSNNFCISWQPWPAKP